MPARNQQLMRDIWRHYRYEPLDKTAVIFVPDADPGELAHIMDFWRDILQGGVRFEPVSGVCEHVDFKRESHVRQLVARVEALMSQSAAGDGVLDTDQAVGGATQS